VGVVACHLLAHPAWRIHQGSGANARYFARRTLPRGQFMNFPVRVRRSIRRPIIAASHLSVPTARAQDRVSTRTIDSIRPVLDRTPAAGRRVRIDPRCPRPLGGLGRRGPRRCGANGRLASGHGTVVWVAPRRRISTSGRRSRTAGIKQPAGSRSAPILGGTFGGSSRRCCRAIGIVRRRSAHAS